MTNQKQNPLDSIIEKIIRESFTDEFILNAPLGELRKRAFAILLSQEADYEPNTILEIAAIALDESNFPEVAREMRNKARQMGEEG